MKYKIGVIFLNKGFFQHNSSISAKIWKLTPYISDHFFIPLSHIPNIGERFIFRTTEDSLFCTVRDKLFLPQTSIDFYHRFPFYKNDVDVYLFFETFEDLKINKSFYEGIESKIINL